MSYQEPEGLILEYSGSWMLEPLDKRYDLTVFLRSLPLLFGDDFVLVLSETHAEGIIEFAAERTPDQTPKLAGMPDSEFSVELSLVPPFVKRVKNTLTYIKLTGDDAEALAAITTHYAEPEVCMSLVVYKNGHVLMDCHDAGCRDGIPFVAGSVDEERVRAFCEAVGLSYSRYVTED